MNNYSSLAAKHAIVANRFQMKSIQQLCIPLIFHVPGEPLQVLPLGLFRNGVWIDPGADAPWETKTIFTVTAQVWGSKGKKNSHHMKKDIVGKPEMEPKHVERMLKFHFVWQHRRIPQEEVKNQLEQGDSFSQIAFDLPILETFIIKQSFMTAAEGVTWHVWIRSSWQLSWATLFLRFYNEHDYIISCFLVSFCCKVFHFETWRNWLEFVQESSLWNDLKWRTANLSLVHFLTQFWGVSLHGSGCWRQKQNKTG